MLTEWGPGLMTWPWIIMRRIFLWRVFGVSSWGVSFCDGFLGVIMRRIFFVTGFFESLWDHNDSNSQQKLLGTSYRGILKWSVNTSTHCDFECVEKALPTVLFETFQLLGCSCLLSTPDEIFLSKCMNPLRLHPWPRVHDTPPLSRNFFFFFSKSNLKG